MDSWDKVKKSSLNIFPSIAGVLRMLFVGSYPFSVNQIGSGSLRYSDSGSALFFIPVRGCKRSFLFHALAPDCQCLSGGEECSLRELNMLDIPLPLQQKP